MDRTSRRRLEAAEEYVRGVEAMVAAVQFSPRPSVPPDVPVELMPPPRLWGRQVADRLDGWFDAGRAESLWAYEERWGLAD